jgi:hypothetical protein
MQINKANLGPRVVKFSWSHTRASLGVDAAVLLLLIPLWLFTEQAYSASSLGMRPNQPIKPSPDIGFSAVYKTNIEAIDQIITNWAGQNGYAMGDQYNWFLNTVPMEKRVAEAGLRESWKTSPFDRWRSTWWSFRSLSPHLAFELVSSENPLETHLTVMANLGQHVPGDLIAALDRLSSAQIQAPSGNEIPPIKAK